MSADLEDDTLGRTSVLMIGPLPPPMGGVSNFVQSVRGNIKIDPRYRIEVYQTGQMGHRPAPVVQVVSDVKRTFHYFRELKGRRPNIVHIHASSYYSFQRNILYVLWTKHFSDSRIVIHLHGGMFMQFYDGASPLGRYNIRGTLRRADAIIVTSPSWIKKIRRITGPEKEVFSLPNGFDPLTFHPEDRARAREKLGIAPAGKVLVTVGDLEEVKGHRYLVEAMRTVRERTDDVRLYIIGRGSRRERLEAQVKELGLNGRVMLINEPLPPHLVARWISASDIFVLPSLSEGNPTVMFESLGCGRPFVGTKVGGIPEVITPEELGVLCEPGDPSDLASSISKALDRKWNALEISAHAQMYSWSSVTSQLADIYDKVMGTDGPP